MIAWYWTLIAVFFAFVLGWAWASDESEAIPK